MTTVDCRLALIVNIEYLLKFTYIIDVVENLG